ncbi:MAG: glycosyltransferase [Nitrospira sp.]|nr:glycosyltransferase [Nitrospira sp.]
MKKILFLTHQCPYPPVSGGAIKRWKIIEYLSKNSSLALAFFYQDQGISCRDELFSRFNISSVYEEHLFKKRNISNLLKSYIRQVPLSLVRNYSATFQRHIEKIAADYEILFLDSYLMFQYVPDGFSGRVVLHMHNAEHVIWEEYARNEKNILKKTFAFREAGKIREYEKVICRKAHAVLAAPKDIECLIKIGVEDDKFYETYHLGDEALLQEPDIEFDKTEEALLCVATLTWEPNTDGLLWFIRNAWDSLKQQFPELRLYIVGRNPDPRLQKICNSRKDIFLPGFVEDLKGYYSKCRVFLAPLRFGSGMKVKVINAMYRGIPAVTTPAGVESLEVQDMRHIAIADTQEKMVEACRVLLQDKAKWEAIRDNSRKLVREKYTWDKVFVNLNKAING